MRRLACFVISLVVLALATTVAVAWVLASFEFTGIGIPHKIARLTGSSRSELNGWTINESYGPGIRMRFLAHRPTSERDRARLLRWLGEPEEFDAPFWSAARNTPKTEQEPIFEDMRGWPLLSFRCVWRVTDDGFLAPRDVLTGGLPITAFDPRWLYDYSGGIPFAQPNPDFVAMNERRALPYVPLWLGLATSVAFYAAAWSPIVFLLSSPGLLRRWRRRRRKRCLCCGYSLQEIESARCPECGWERDRRLPLLTNGRIAITLSLAMFVIAFDAIWAEELHRRFEGPPAVHLAARDNDVPRLERELRRGADPDCRFRSSELDYFRVEDTTPLMWAAAHGSCDALRVLIDAGADLNANSAGGLPTSPLIFAVLGTHADAVELLLAAGAEFDQSGVGTPEVVWYAACTGSTEVLRAFIEAGAAFDVADQDGKTPLCDAAGVGDHRMVSYLLELGAEVNPPTKSPPLLRAAKRGSLESVRLLLESGARVTSEAGPLLWEAAGQDDVTISEMLIAAGADPNRPPDPNQGGWTPLRRAVERSDCELVRLLLSAGADPLLVTKEEATLLFEIRWEEASEELVDILLALGIDVNHRNGEGKTALAEAVHSRERRAVRRLLEAGADPAIRDNEGRTSLDYAQDTFDHLYAGGVIRTSGAKPDPVITRLLEEAMASE